MPRRFPVMREGAPKLFLRNLDFASIRNVGFHALREGCTFAAFRWRRAMNANAIELRVENGDWVAQWSGPEGQRIAAAFGTNVLPTPFRACVDANQVRATIAGLNPGVSVTVRA